MAPRESLENVPPKPKPPVARMTLAAYIVRDTPPISQKTGECLTPLVLTPW